MKNHQGYQEKSRLGRLLVNRGHISEAQLEQALAEQRTSGVLLGELLVASGWVTERELSRALRQQRHYRRAAAVVAMVTLPLQPAVTLASAAPEKAEGAVTSGEMLDGSGFRPLTEAEMSGVSGQGADDLLARIDQVSRMPDAVAAGEDGKADAIEGLKLVAHTFVPVLNFLDSDLTISGVHYREDGLRLELLADGGLRMALPERIESVEMNDIRVSGTRGPSMGNVSLHNIRFAPESHMTIYTRP
ncbi:pilus assembly protein PilB [Marinobacter halodurans]|uniref:Pilus assembly protein PilB n=1 Tax=Marinobacter halodurans TaxID=2528979 RepID=A0ABY1ZTJ3_9GAMM|nr:pilus assembly protein PilB [Marinobacter halodurans]TBW59010.1 pilus assembly protein PilB [Marinobacter halodurans]